MTIDDDFDLGEMERDAEELAKALPRDSQIKALSDLCSTQLMIEDEIINLEAALTVAKERLKAVSEGEIPELMGQLGVQEIKLTNGREVSIKPFVSAKTSPAVVEWLSNNGYEDTVKGELKVIWPKGFDINVIRKLAGLIAQEGLSPEVKETVHTQTLWAWCREAVRKGIAFPADVFEFYQGFKASIK